MQDCEIRRAKGSEMSVFNDWAVSEGWDPGHHDAECFYFADPNGFFIATSKDEIIGVISAVSYEDGYGFVGFYIVKPEFRKQGFGMKLWNTALEYLDGYSIGLDGVPTQQENYEKSGFALSHKNIRWSGISRKQDEAATGIVPIAEVSHDLLFEYDKRIFGFNRKTFLKHWISAPSHIGFAKVANNKIAGYGVIRPCRSGWKVGPLFAKKSKTANQILAALCSSIPVDSEFFLDTPENNKSALELAESLCMTRVFETARMYKGNSPKIKYTRWYSVSSFELG